MKKDWKPTDAPAAGSVRSVVRAQLEAAGVRMTRQRLTLATLLFADGHCHVTAEMLHAKAQESRSPVAAATVYNVLRQFCEAGLLREIPAPGRRSWYDTNTIPHHHFLLQGEEGLFDIPADEIGDVALPNAPEGMEIVSAELVVRVRRTAQGRR